MDASVLPPSLSVMIVCQQRTTLHLRSPISPRFTQEQDHEAKPINSLSVTTPPQISASPVYTVVWREREKRERERATGQSRRAKANLFHFFHLTQPPKSAVSPFSTNPMATRPPTIFPLLRRRWQPIPAAAAALLLQLLMATADPYDEACLSKLRSSLEDPSYSLRNWTKSTFASPCNGFTSYLDGATCNNGRIYKLSLPGRSLRGSISPFLSNCTNLQSLDLSSNSIAGPIPSELSSLLNLAVLNLSANALSGHIPPQLALCAYLNVIDLHSNDLSGRIPDQLGLLVRLSAFDVSDNRLEGPIPVLLANRTGFPRFNASAFSGNKDLYGYPLPPFRGRVLSVLTIVGIGLGSGILSLLLSFAAVCIWLKSTEQNSSGGGMISAEDGKISHLMPEY